MTLANFKQKAWAAAAVLFAATVALASCSPIDGTDPIDQGTVQDADIVAFTFSGIDGSATIDKSSQTVSAKAAEGVDLTALVVDFTLSLDATATVDGRAQQSGTTANDFSRPVTYSVTSGDGETYKDWRVTITGEGGPGEDPTGDFTKREFKTVKEVMDFFPEGVWIYEYEDKGWSNDRTLYAKASDGSFTYSEMEGDPKKSNYGDVSLWYVWKGDSYYSLNYTNEYDPDVTHYWKVWARYPGENLLQSTDTQYGLKSINVSTPWGGIPTAQPGETMEPFMLGMGMSLTPFLAFIASDVCSTAVFAGNATVEGIACKKYSTSGGTDYYVLDNGFCLQKDGPEGLGSWSDFSIISATTTAASCDAVLQTYYQDGDVFNAPTTMDVQAITQMHNGPEWISGSGGWVIPWTAGGIKYMSEFYELGDASPHTFTAELDQTAFNDAQRSAYISQVMTVPYMKVKEDTNMENEYLHLITFRANNDDDALVPEGRWGPDVYKYIAYQYSQSEMQGVPVSCSISIWWVSVGIY